METDTMGSKPLLYYCNNRVDEPVFRQIEERVEIMSREQKTKLAVAALSLNLPSTLVPLTKAELAELQLINKLSAQGQLELAEALISQVRWG